MSADSTPGASGKSSAGPPRPGHPPHHDATTIDTLQSLIVAFVLAMTFRGFVTEGFVIPTGSMAPTLLGQHLLMYSDQTGATYPVDVRGVLDALAPPAPHRPEPNRLFAIKDPTLGPGYTVAQARALELQPRMRMGDRILVLKSIYPFSEPDRFDVVVFKNPTDPIGEATNYIKRLIGLPNETVWLADGDVFVMAEGGEKFEVQRKPDHVQRAVWQSVHDSDALPMQRDRLGDLGGARYHAGPWKGDPAQWSIAGQRSYELNTAAESTLEWDNDIRAIDDWTAYNMLISSPHGPMAVSDVRVCAAIEPLQDGLACRLEVATRGHVFEFMIGQGRAIVQMRPLNGEPALQKEAAVELPKPGRVFNVEFWHVDQSMQIYLDGERVFEEPLRYDWSPRQRLTHAAKGSSADDPGNQQPGIRWHFEGSPLTLHRVRLDRDLHYRRDRLSGHAVKNPSRHSEFDDLVEPGTAAFGTDAAKLAKLGPDQFMMAGDNSQLSLDSRLWGHPHPLVAEQIDPAPFIVNRKMLLGKAWVVYFPAPYRLKDGGVPFVPDFGRLRFIR